MRTLIFTLFLAFGCLVSTYAQPLAGSPLPDTITYHKLNREIYTYNADKLVKELTSYWYQPESAPYTRFGYRTRYEYNSDKKLKEVYGSWTENDPNGTLRESFLYNKQGFDSLNVKYNYVYSSWTGDKIINYEYDSNNRLIVKTETNSNATATYPVNIEKWEYNSTGELLSFSLDRYDNVTSALIDKSKITYEYENNLLKFETIQYWDIVKNDWIQGLKFEYLYLDNNTKPDVKQFYQYQNNQYVKLNAKYEYVYTDTSYTEIFRQNINYFDRSVTTYVNSNQQEVLTQAVEYCPNLSIYQPRSRKETFYLSNGAFDKILEYEVDACTVKDTIFIEKSKITYGYKQDISSTAEREVLQNSILIFPNPASDFIHIDSKESSIQSVSVVNIQGQVIQNKNLNDTKVMIERNGAPSGLYYLNIQTEKGQISKPIIWQE